MIYRDGLDWRSPPADRFPRGQSTERQSTSVQSPAAKVINGWETPPPETPGSWTADRMVPATAGAAHAPRIKVKRHPHASPAPIRSGVITSVVARYGYGFYTLAVHSHTLPAMSNKPKAPCG